MDNEIIETDEKFNIKNVSVMNVDGDILLSLEVSDINYKPDYDDSYFDLDIKESNEEPKDDDKCASCTDEECKKECDVKTTSNILEEIVYPLYVPKDTYLSSKDKVATDEGNRVILTFKGTDPFILVEEVSKKNDEFKITPISGEPVMMSSTVGAMTSNSLYFSNNGVDYYLTSNSLNNEEMMMVAESITNGEKAVASMK